MPVKALTLKPLPGQIYQGKNNAKSLPEIGSLNQGIHFLNFKQTYFPLIETQIV